MANCNIFSAHQKQTIYKNALSRFIYAFLILAKLWKLYQRNIFTYLYKIVNPDSALDIQLKTNKEYEIA